MIPRRLLFPRRLVATFVSLTLGVSGLLVVVAAPANAATTRAFTPVFTANVTGDVTIRGNTLETCLAGSVQAQGSITCASTQAGASQQNNNYFMTYVDADGTTGGNTTFDSSSATVTVPAGATVLYAGLSWGAVTSAGALTGYPALTGVAAPDAAAKGSALFQAPGAGSYSAVTSTTTDINGGNYQAYVDVTNTVKAAGSGTYSVANVQAGTGGGNYAGWSLAVAYSDPTAPLRNLTVFTGYNQVSGATPSVDIPVSGFLTPATGAVSTKVGVVAYEGDKGSVGDGLSIGATALYNTLNPINDVFNSSLTDLNVAVTDRTPNYANMLGFDIDRLDATGALANGSTSTVLHYTTANPGGETYYPGMLTFATDLSASALTATKSVVDVNGGNVSRGDRLNYSVVVTNGGGDGASSTVLTDATPAGTTYLPGTLTIGGTAVTDATGDDTGDVSAGNVTARLGTGASSSAGGVLAPAASVTVTFAVTVNSNSTANDGTALPNTALFTNRDQTTGTGYSGGSNTVTSTVVVPPALSGTLTSPGEVGAAYSSGFTLNGGTGTGPYVWSISAGALPDGLSINSSTGLITGTPTTAGTFTPTVLVSDANNRTGTRSQSISITAAPSVTFAPPGGEAGVAYSAQPAVTGGTGTYTWSTTGTLPAGLSINPSTGLISGTPTTAGTTSVTVQVVDANGVSAIKTASIVIVAAPLLTFTAPPAGEVTVPYSNQLTFTGGVGPYTWSVSVGTLPAGLTLNASTGLLSGTPTTAGSSSFTVKIVDGNGLSDTKAATLVIGPGPTVTFTPPAGEVTVAYSAQPTVSGGVGPYTWSVTTGTLPAGLTINPSTGLIAGTPTTAGTTPITVKAVDTNGVSSTAAASIVINAGPALTFAAPPAGELAVAYSDQLTFTGGVGPFTWSVSTGALPGGLTLNAGTGLLSGTPTASGTFGFTVRIVDSNGVADTKAVTLVIAKSATTITLTAPASVQFGTTVTLSASVSPTAAGGTVTFTDVPTTGAQSGTTVTLGTDTLATGTAHEAFTLPAFGVNTITAHYNGDATHAATDSSTQQVEVSAYAGEVIVTEFRSSGPAGANDSYIELLNTGATVPLAGIVVSTSSGSTSTLPVTAGLLGTRRSYLITGSAFSLGAAATSDFTSTLGTGGITVTAPDTALTRTDAVGPSTGFHLGTGLPAMTGTPTAQYAWVRREIAGAAVDTHDNAADFALVSTSLTPVGGVQPTLGSASPTGTADPYQTNAGMTSTLFNTTVAASAPPNRIILTGPPRQLVIQRTITNTSGATITSARVRITALSELHGPPEPGVSNQPTRVANLRAVNPVAAPGAVHPDGVPASKLTVDYPITDSLGGGLNSTLTLPLPGGGLAPGDFVRVAFTFDIDTSGTFWFGYDVDAITAATGNARHASQPAHVSPRATRTHKPGDTGRIR